MGAYGHHSQQICLLGDTGRHPVVVRKLGHTFGGWATYGFLYYTEVDPQSRSAPQLGLPLWRDWDETRIMVARDQRNLAVSYPIDLVGRLHHGRLMRDGQNRQPIQKAA